MVGLGYFWTARTHTCSNEEYVHKSNIVKTILREKGFPTKIIIELENAENNQAKDSKVKRFIGTTVWDKVSKRHSFIKQIFNKFILNKETYYLHIFLGKKLEKYIFTIKKMRTKLNF